jgi:hypothetical protein
MCFGANFLTSFVNFSGNPLNNVFPPDNRMWEYRCVLISISTFDKVVLIISGKAF